MKEKILTSLTLLALGLLALTCKKEPPPAVQVPALELVAEDASCTEVWLRIRSVEVPATVRLMRDGQAISVLGLRSPDSLLIDEGLLPKRTYTYKAQLLEPCLSGRQAQTPNLIASTPDVHVTTMDTTSHSFSFEIDTLGDGGGSVLYDVAIINDSLAYAVGEIYKRDSLGNWDPNAYNFVKWNGNTWQLMRIQFYTFCGQSGTGSYPAKSIFAFSPTDIWIGMYGSQVVRWNGQTQTAPMCTPVSINKLWGENPASVWAVGVNGGIAHYNGSTWRRVESGTNVDLRDIYGNIRGQRLWAVGYLTDFSNSSFLEYNGHSWRLVRRQSNATPRYPDSLSGIMTSVCSFNDLHVDVASSAGMYRTRAGSTGEAKRTWLPEPFSVGLFNRVRGSERNNVFVVAPFGTFAHYNGVVWKQYQEFFSLSGHPNLLSLSVDNNTVTAVGYSGVRAIVIRGRKQ